MSESAPPGQVPRERIPAERQPLPSLAVGDPPTAQLVGPGQDATVIGVAIAGIVSVVVTEDQWDLFDSMVGLVLLLVLLAYGRFRREVVASPWEAAAVGAVFAFCAVLVFGLAIDHIQSWLRWPGFAQTNRAFEGFWFCAVWLLLTVIFALILYVAGERLVHPAYRPPERQQP
jgi:uncharacterized membrane protein